MARFRKIRRLCGILSVFAVRLACLVILWAVLVGATMNFVGPTSGWIERSLNTLRQPRAESAPIIEHDSAPALHSSVDVQGSNTPPLPPPDPIDGQGIAKLDPDVGIPPPEPPRKTRLEMLYESLRAAYLDEFHAPKAGQRYTIRLRDGRRVTGTLLEAKPGSLTVQLEYGSMVIPIHRVASTDYPRFFPERAASLAALHDLRDTQARIARTGQPSSSMHSPEAEATANPAIDETEAGADTVPGTTDPDTSIASEKVTFQPIPRKSDDEFRPALTAFAQWLEYQHRRVGGRIATTVYAKRHNDAAVLYLVMAPQFLAQDYDLRFQLAEGLWQFWAFRCEAMGIARHAESAYIAMLDDQNEIIGGSRPDDAGSVWMEQDVGPIARK